MRFLSVVFIFNFFLVIPLLAEKDSHEGQHHSNEIGIVSSPVYFINEKTIAYGQHFHYSYYPGESDLGFGLGYERIFDKHKHNSILITGNYRIIDNLNLSISPGLSFEDKDPSDLHLVFHIESFYEFEIDDFHIGPSIEFAYSTDDYHLSIGLHIGFIF